MKTKQVRRQIIIAGLLTFCASAYAAENVLEEVLVTATKRGSQDVQSIPASIFAVGGKSLEDKANFSFRDIASNIPGLTFQDLGPGDMEFIIRGVNGNGPAVVGSYFGEYVITASDQQDGGGKNAPIKLVDIERVEVLNGPQGTLYGANSMAGNVRYIPRKADPSKFESYGEIDYSNIRTGGDGYEANAVINLPIFTDKLAIRLVGYRTDMDGWIDQPRLQTGPNTFDGNAKDINSEETDGVRVGIFWQASDRLSVDFMYVGQRTDIGGASRFTAKGSPAWPAETPAIANLPGSPGYADLAGVPSLTPDRNFINTDITQSPRDDDVDLFGTTLTYDTGVGSFVLSASDYEHKIDYTFDSTPILLFFQAPVAGITNQPQSYKIKMAEGRFASSFSGPFNFVAGVYYQKEKQDFAVHVTTTDGNGGNVPWNPLTSNDTFLYGGTAIFGRFRNDEIEQKAIYGEATYDFTDRWQLKGGLRYFKVNLTSDQGTTHAFGNGFGFPVPVPEGEIVGTTANDYLVGRLKSNEDQVTPMVALSYHWTDDVMTYILYSEGFRTGGVNNSNQPFAPGIPPIYDSDKLKNYELGIKSQLLENHMQFNATLFHIDWSDIQVEPRDPAGNIPFTTNGGKAEINGVEWGVKVLMTDNLQLAFTGTGFFKHELTTDQPVLPGASPYVIVGQKGDKIPNVASTQYNLSLTYDHPVGDGMSLQLIGDATYRGSTNTEFRPDSPFNIPLDSYTQFDVFVNLDLNEHWTIGAYVKNLTDEFGVIDGIGTFQDPRAIIALRPRTFGARLVWRQ